MIKNPKCKFQFLHSYLLDTLKNNTQQNSIQNNLWVPKFQSLYLIANQNVKEPFWETARQDQIKRIKLISI